jgi:ribosomal protection tetracycline resistance protein
LKQEKNKTRDVITLGIFAHANAGKTTLTENLLYNTGAIDHIGKVDDGDTVTDSLEVEKRRGISVKASLISFDIDNNKTIQLIDTPGHVDFSSEVERSMAVLDCAVIVISAADGLEAQTYSLWKNLSKKDIPIIFFVNKMDRMGADYCNIIKQLRKEFSPNIASIIDVNKSKKGSITFSNPDDDDLLGCLSNIDDDILKEYVFSIDNKTKINKEWLDKKIYNLIQKQYFYPVIGGATLKNVGSKNLLDILSKYIFPYKREIDNSFCGFIYSVKVDGRIKHSYIKILTGEINIRDNINVGEGEFQQIKSIRKYSKGQLVSVKNAQSGDIVILTGLNVPCGSFVGEKGNSKLREQAFVKPLLNMNVNSIDDKSDNKLMDALKVLNEEDPYLNLRYNKRTKNILVTLMGEVQAQILETMLKERFGVEAVISNPVVICKEKPYKVSVGLASYTTVSAVSFKISPLEKGMGIVYKSETPTGTLHKKYQSQIKKLVKRYLKQGIYGWEVVDAEVILVDGKFDSMGSETHHFNIATPIALFRALKNSNVKVLEPICSFYLKVNKEHVSKVSQYLYDKGASCIVQNAANKKTNIKGEGRLSELLNLPVDLNKMTSGYGECFFEISKYRKAISYKENEYIGPDPRNETTFIIKDMDSSLRPLDAKFKKKIKGSSSKYMIAKRKKRIQAEKKLEKKMKKEDPPSP